MDPVSGAGILFETNLMPTDGSSPEPAGDILFRLFFRRVGKDLLGFAKLDDMSLKEEGGEIGDPGGLLHVVGDNDDGVAFF